jgi:hypothetical protein
MKSAFLHLAALLLSTAPAMASNWNALQHNSEMLLEAGAPLPETSDGQDKAKNKEKILKVWSKATYPRPEQARPGDFYYSSEKTLREINCTKRTYRVLQKIYYSSDGQEIKSVRNVGNVNSENIVPDSAAEIILDFSCASKVANKEIKPARSSPPKSPVSPPKKASSKNAENPTPEKKTPEKAAPKEKAPDKGKPSASKKSASSEAEKPKR